MTRINGHYYQQGSSARKACSLQVTDDGHATLLDEQQNPLRNISWQQLNISSRLGNTPRFLTFPDGLRVETSENDAVDLLQETHSPQSGSNWLHLLESKFRFVLVTLIAVILFVWAMFQYGAPVIAKAGSKWVPQEIVEFIGQQSLDTLDQIYFSPTELTPDAQQRVTEHLRPLIADHADLHLKVIFRSTEEGIPNAFALPNGTLIFTDAMVNLAKEDDELLAIAAHEVGHVHYRHSMRHMIQSSILTFMFAVIAGDISGTSEVFLGIPVTLTELSYSREFEREADSYSFQWLKENSKSPLLFASIMGRMENAIQCREDDKDCKTGHGRSSKWLDYFSTHPPTDERITKAINGGGG